jgi:hypothetical protein
MQNQHYALCTNDFFNTKFNVEEEVKSKVQKALYRPGQVLRASGV